MRDNPTIIKDINQKLQKKKFNTESIITPENASNYQKIHDGLVKWVNLRITNNIRVGLKDNYENYIEAAARILICGAQKRSILDLSRLGLKDPVPLPDCLAFLADHLTTLDLSENGIKHLTLPLAKLKKLEVLNLEKNFLFSSETSYDVHQSMKIILSEEAQKIKTATGQTIHIPEDISVESHNSCLILLSLQHLKYNICNIKHQHRGAYVEDPSPLISGFEKPLKILETLDKANKFFSKCIKLIENYHTKKKFNPQGEIYFEENNKYLSDLKERNELLLSAFENHPKVRLAFEYQVTDISSSESKENPSFSSGDEIFGNPAETAKNNSPSCQPSSPRAASRDRAQEEGR